MGIVIDEVFTEITGPAVPAKTQQVAVTPADVEPQTRKILQIVKRQEWRAHRLSAD